MISTKTFAYALAAVTCSLSLCTATAFANPASLGAADSQVSPTAAAYPDSSAAPSGLSALNLSAQAVAIGESFTVDGLVFQVTSAGSSPTVSVGLSGSQQATALASGFAGTSVDIPNTVVYEGTTFSVASIANYAFADCSSIATLHVPSSVLSIGKNAFQNCTALSAVTLEEGLETLNNYAFTGCTALAEIDLPATLKQVGTTSGDYTGGSYVFFGCTSLKSVSFGKADSNGSIALASRCFTGCTNLETVDLRNNVATLEANCFHTLASLKYVVGVDSVTKMGRQCFVDCTSLIRFSSSGKDRVDLLNADMTLSSFIFSGCTALDDLYLTAGTSSSLNGGYGKQYGPFCKSGIKHATLVGDWTDIPQGLFYDTVSLESVAIPSTVQTIGSEAFDGCTALKSISLPASLESIGSSAFSGCTSLATVSFSEECGAVTFGTNCFIDCAALTRIAFPEGTSAVPDGCFSGCTSLEYVKLPDSVVSIGAQAFSSVVTTGTSSSWVGVQDNEHENCKSLTTIEYAGQLQELYAQAFYGCTNLEGSFDLSLLEEVPYQAFTGCTKLESVTISETTKAIGGQAFYGCSSLTFVGPPSAANGDGGILLPSTVETIGSYAFGQCSSAQAILLPSQITELLAGTFTGCSSVDEIYLPETIAAIGTGCFSDCSSLTAITVPSGVNSIEPNLFEGCTALESVTLPNAVKTIGDSAFSKCSHLLTVTLPESLVRIGASAFAKCQRLAWVDFTHVSTAQSLEIASSAFDTNNAYSKYVFNDNSVPAGFAPGSGSVYQILLSGPTGYHQSAVTPLSILCDGKAADPSDYLITYSDNKAIGTAHARVAIGSCVVEREFTIGEWDWANTIATLSYTTTYYDGAAKKPAVRIDGLTAGTDFKVEYSNNTNIGTAKVTITPLTVSGTAKTLTFAIKVKAGATYTAGNLQYKVTNASTNGKGTLKVASFKGSTTASIPATVKIGGVSFKVTAIAAAAFKGNAKLRTLTIGSNVASIAAKSFYGCKNLKKVLFKSKKLPSVGALAFKKVKAKIAIGTKGSAKALRKLLLKKGLPKTATVIKA